MSDLQAITVLGLSRSGVAVARYAARRGLSVLLSDTQAPGDSTRALQEELQALGVQVELGGHSQACLTHAPLMVISPGIPPHAPILQQAAAAGLEIISEVEFAARQNAQTHHIPLIAITGTNGKTTTTTLISHILTTAGLYAPTCGNIGTPITEVLDQDRVPDYLVAELSSFQLHFSPTLRAEIAVFLNLTPDHLDWHGSLEAYRDAKMRLFTGAQSPAWAVLKAEDPVSRLIAANTQARCAYFSIQYSAVSQYPHTAYCDPFGQMMLGLDPPPRLLARVDELPLFGAHNQENFLAAASVAALLKIAPDAIRRACLSFEGVAHRIEYVETVGRVKFYNDSKATNVDATLTALAAFGDQRVILLAGGRDKNTPLDALVERIKQQASHVLLYGEAKERFSQALAAQGYHHWQYAEDLQAAVPLALSLSQGEPVLLSPACASFDQFKHFEARGDAFKAIVRQLARESLASAPREVG